LGWDGVRGGVRVSIYSDVNVATENTVFGMPENELGFSDNVGAGAYLSKIRNRIGMFMLMGRNVGGDDLVKGDKRIFMRKVRN